MSSSCSSSGIAWAISRAPVEEGVDRAERPGHRQPAEEPPRALEQRRDGGRERARRDDVEPVDRERAAIGRRCASAPSRRSSPATRLADEPVEDASGDEPAVLGGRADVVDGIAARRPASRRRGRRSRASAGGPRGRPRSRVRTDRGGRHGPERQAHVGPRCAGATARRPSRQPSATTTLLIDWARRVPTLRKRSSRPASSGIRMRSRSSSGARAVCR